MYYVSILHRVPYTTVEYTTEGIYLALYDSEGKLYDRIASGVHDTVDEYKKALDSIYNIICELI